MEHAQLISYLSIHYGNKNDNFDQTDTPGLQRKARLAEGIRI